MIGDKKEVYFNEYCIKCIYLNDNESNPKCPCFDCLETPAREDSHVPINFIDATK